MKSFYRLLMGVFLLLGLVACGGDKGDGTKSPEPVKAPAPEKVVEQPPPKPDPSEMARIVSRDYFERKRQSIKMGAREACEMSGAGHRCTNIMMAALERYYTGRGNTARNGYNLGVSETYSKNWQVAGREHMIDMLQIGLAGGTRKSSNADRNRAIEIVNIIKIRDLKRFYKELKEEREPALRDLGHTAECLYNNRRILRSRKGTGRPAKVQKVLKKFFKIKLKSETRRNDLDFLNRKGGVLSTNLANELYRGARAALKRVIPYGSPTGAQIDRLQGHMLRWLRDGTKDGYTTLNRNLCINALPYDDRLSDP